MIVIDYIDGVNRPQQVTFDNYDTFVLSQQSCWHDIPDHFQATKVTINSHDLHYTGLYGNIYHFLLKQDLTQY